MDNSPINKSVKTDWWTRNIPAMSEAEKHLYQKAIRDGIIYLRKQADDHTR